MTQSTDCKVIETEPAPSSHWYDDGDVIVELQSGQGETAARYRVHKPVLTTRSEFFDEKLSSGACWTDIQDPPGWGRNAPYVVVVEDERERFQLWLDWVYERQGRKFDIDVLRQMLIACDRYGSHGMRETCQQLAQYLPDSVQLLEIAFEYRLSETLCCRLAAWALRQSNSKFTNLFGDGCTRWQTYLLRLMLCYEMLPCNDCRALMIDAVQTSAGTDALMQHLISINCPSPFKFIDAVRRLCPFRMEFIS